MSLVYLDFASSQDSSMGRKATNCFLKFFRYDPSTGKSHCLIEGCESRPLTGKHGSALEKHVKCLHKNKFEETIQEQGELLKRKSNGEGPSAKRVKILMSPEQLWDACVRLVTVHGRPFQLIEDKAFQDIVRPIIEGFENSVSINSHNILTGIQEKATQIRLETSQLLQGRIFSLKIDACT